MSNEVEESRDEAASDMLLKLITELLTLNAFNWLDQ